MSSDSPPKPWMEVSLGDYVDLLTGFPFKSANYSEDGVRLIRGDNVVQGQLRWEDVKRWPATGLDEVSEYALAEGDVVLAMDRPWIEAGLKYAALTRDDIPSLLVQRVARLRARRGLDQGFLRYIIGSRDFTQHVLAIQTGTAVPHISSSQIKSFKFVLPPLPEQKRIAHILGTLDEKIELNRRMNATLEGIARALFKSWFIDFDPVHAKAAGKKPAGMDKATADLFPDSFQDSTIGTIPLGWKTGSILEIADLLSGGTPKTSEQKYWGGTIPWASAADVSQCGEMFLVSTDRQITQEGLDNSSTQIIPAYASVVVARGATTGRMTMFGADIAMNQTCYALRSKSNTPRFLHFLLRHEIGGLVQSAHGSVFDTITTATFKSAKVLLPVPQVAKAFDLLVESITDRVLFNLRESRTLSSAREALLLRLLSGGLTGAEPELPDILEVGNGSA